MKNVRALNLEKLINNQKSQYFQNNTYAFLE